MDRPESKHRVISLRSWWDSEPDRLSIGVELDSTDGKAHVVFTCSSTWIAPEKVHDEIIPWLDDCQQEAIRLNGGGQAPPEQVWWELEIRMSGITVTEDAFLDAIEAHDLCDMQWTSDGKQVSAYILRSFDATMPEVTVREHMFAHQFSAVTRVRLAFPGVEMDEPILSAATP